MALQTSPQTGFEKWQDGINKAMSDARWQAWDCEIQMAVNQYNRHLSGTAGYVSLDWHLIKAMAWVETGAHDADWNVKPMRIGVPGDPGLASLLASREGGDLILPPAWKGQLTLSSARTLPAHNLRAGIGYLLMKLANYGYRNTPDAHSKVFEITVKSGDSLDKIARAQVSTVEMLKQLNPTAGTLRVGQTLKCRRAVMQRIVTSWRPITTTVVAQRYNGGGDPYYARKLDHALPLVRQGKVAPCEA